MIEINSYIGKITIESIIISILALMITIVFGNLIYFLTRRFFDQRINRNFSKVISRFFNYVVYFVGIYLIFNNILGLNLSSLLTAAGILTILIGLSTQQTFQNIIAGIILMIERPIRIGDWVEVAGFPQAGVGRVKDMTLFRVVIRRLDGSIFYAPNANLITGNIFNYTKGGFIRSSFMIEFSPENDIQKVEKIITDICRKHPLVLPNITKSNILDNILDRGKIPKIDYLYEKFSKMLESGVNVNAFAPKVVFKSMTTGKVTAEVWIRIIDMSKRDEIISELLSEIIKEFKKKKIKL
ncbi:MAG: mechanosensitive ion channel family protein [Candidatus Aenigmarchaeota archaeon]|nr:mechanosensitive ion channel family protein [Candidatus Aenigmarchaeota archaeon]